VTRSLAAVLAAAASMLACGPSHAFYAGGVQQGPWCAGYSIGWSWQENCTMPSLEYCRTQVIAGNRGVCFPNPSWAALPQAPRKPRSKRKPR
jgi:hypothetical protein